MKLIKPYPLIRGLKKALPYILSGLSVAGVAATAIFSSKATAKALAIAEKNQLTEKGEIFKQTWKCYIPVALTAIATAACILGNGVISRKKQMSLIAAYSLLAKNYKQYRDEVKELYGEEADKKVISTIAIQHVPKEHAVFQPGLASTSCLDWGANDDETPHLFYDSFSERYFTSTVSQVLQAEIGLNRDLSICGFVSLNDFYVLLGIDEIDGGNEVGWCVCDGYTFLDFHHYRALLEESPDGENFEAYVIDADWPPMTEEELDNL